MTKDKKFSGHYNLVIAEGELAVGEKAFYCY
jgi:hypothetical protein